MKQSLIWKNYHKPLFNFILFKVNDKDLAEDIIQNVWLSLLRSMLNQEKIDNLAVWLFDVASIEINEVTRKFENPYKSFDTTETMDNKQAVISYLKAIQNLSVEEISFIVEEPQYKVKELLEKEELNIQF